MSIKSFMPIVKTRGSRFAAFDVRIIDAVARPWRGANGILKELEKAEVALERRHEIVIVQLRGRGAVACSRNATA